MDKVFIYCFFDALTHANLHTESSVFSVNARQKAAVDWIRFLIADNNGKNKISHSARTSIFFTRFVICNKIYGPKFMQAWFILRIIKVEDVLRAIDIAVRYFLFFFLFFFYILYHS